MVAAYAIGGMDHPYLKKRLEFHRHLNFTDLPLFSSLTFIAHVDVHKQPKNERCEISNNILRNGSSE